VCSCTHACVYWHACAQKPQFLFNHNFFLRTLLHATDNMQICTYMHVCVCVCVFVCICTGTHDECMYVRMYLFTYTSTHTPFMPNQREHAYVMSRCNYVCMYSDTPAYIYPFMPNKQEHAHETSKCMHVWFYAH
jgi:hypothetical protein